MPFVVSLQGIIGAGKSSVLQELRERQPAWHILSEPVFLWEDFHGYNMLAKYYAQPKETAFEFQLVSALSTAAQLQVARELSDDDGVIVVERSLLGCQIFVEALYKLGYLTDLQRNLLTDLYDLQNVMGLGSDAVILLDTDPHIATGRLKRRAHLNDGESNVTEEYNAALADAHADWYRNATDQDVCLIDGNCDMSPEYITKIDHAIQHCIQRFNNRPLFPEGKRMPGANRAPRGDSRSRRARRRDAV